MAKIADERRRRASLAYLDLFERTWITVMFGALATRLLGSTGGLSTINLLLLLSEAMVVMFVLTRRRAQQVSPRPLDWALAFAASSGPLLVAAGGDPVAPITVGVSITGIGFALQVAAKMTLCRSFGVVPANRGVKVSGPYRLVRHPMYAGYVITHLGFLLLNPTGWNAAVYLASFVMQVFRLRAEEQLLGEDERYRRYRAEVRYRLLPGVF